MLSQAIEEHLGIQAGEPAHLLVSCSGGPDSMALLHSCFELQSRHEKLRVTALHIHFALRGVESDGDAEFVEQTCRDWSIPLMTFKADWNPKRVNQERTRLLRLKLSQQLLPQAYFLEAHHQDDQAETFMFRLLRSSGLNGLEAMRSPALRQERLVWRPFLKYSKAELLHYLEQRGIAFRVDQSNLKSDYQRNWIRNELFPRLEKEFPYFREAILRTRQQIQDENQFFETEVSQLLERSVLHLKPLRLAVTELKAQAPALQARFFRWLFAEEFQILLEREKVDELLQLLKVSPDFVWNAPRGLQLRLSEGVLSFGPQYQRGSRKPLIAEQGEVSAY